MQITRTVATSCLLAVVVAASPALAEPPEGLAQGIQVHGHWKLEIFDPDGTLVRVTEFENALTPSGAEGLAQLLAREQTTGLWAVTLAGSDDICLDNGSGDVCYLVEPTGSDGSSNQFESLSIQRNGGVLVVEGSFSAQDDGNITAVSASWHRCSALDPPGCGAGLGMTTSSFTSSGLPSAEAVVTGQLVQVTVTISFS